MNLPTSLIAGALGGPLLPGFSADTWMDFCKLFAAIDRDPAATELRQKLERIAEQKDVPFQKRAREMLPLLLPLLPMGSVQ
jgi:hypothetical protein